jgi:single-strand DNA-binding protein
MSVNKVILVGRLGRDPESRFTSSGQQVCNFTLATDESFKDRAGERQKRTEWHRIVVWGRLAEITQQYLKRGTLVYIEGRLQTRQWDDRSGNKRTTTEIIANGMKILSPRGESGGAGPSVEASSGAEIEETQAPGESPISDEDIPF